MTGDELDRILEEALVSYARAEPRPGLAGRVMARVRSEGAVSSPAMWWMAAATAVLVCLAVAAVTARHENRRTPVAVRVSTPEAHVPVKVNAPVLPPHSRKQQRRTVRAHRDQVQVFLSSSPLTPEERALVEFVQRAPEAARQLPLAGEPLQVEAINVRPLEIDGLVTGEIK